MHEINSEHQNINNTVGEETGIYTNLVLVLDGDGL